MKKYLDLSDEQIENLVNFLDKANGPQLDLIKEDFVKLKSGKNNAEYRSNILHALMTDDINFNFYEKWTANLYLNTPNTIFVYEPKDPKVLKLLKKKAELSNIRLKKKYIFDINADNLKKIELIDITEDRVANQLLFSFVTPSTIIKDKMASEQIFLENEVYFSYVWIDFNLNKVVISIPPHPKHYSINGELIKRNQTEKIANIILKNFKKEIKPFDLSSPNWIILALYKITDEYFDHNNPIITRKINHFKGQLSDEIVKLISEFDSKLTNDFSRLKIEKNIVELVENELISGYGRTPSSSPFSIFLHEVDKGITQYRANNGSNAFDFDDSREVVKKMVENAQISAIGLKYNYDGKDVSYKIFKSYQFFALKRLSTGTTKKEIVDNVLLELDKYKKGLKPRSISRSNQKTE